MNEKKKKNVRLRSAVVLCIHVLLQRAVFNNKYKRHHLPDLPVVIDTLRSLGLTLKTEVLPDKSEVR